MDTVIALNGLSAPQNIRHYAASAQTSSSSGSFLEGLPQQNLLRHLLLNSSLRFTLSLPLLVSHTLTQIHTIIQPIILSKILKPMPFFRVCMVLRTSQWRHGLTCVCHLLCWLFRYILFPDVTLYYHNSSLCHYV